ncbi:hypothetical protein V6N13_083340 [Hibiscus sabdariffa]
MAIFMALEVHKEANWLNQDPVIESDSKVVLIWISDTSLGCGIGGNYFESLIVDRASTSYGQLWILLLVRVKMPRPSIFWASHGEWHYDDDCDDLIQVLQR